MLLLLLTVSLVGCGGGGNAGEGAVALMDKLPKDAQTFQTFIFIDIKAIRADTDLDRAYETVKDSMQPGIEVLGVSVDDVESEALSGSVTILEGQFDLDEVKQELEGNGYEANKYNEVDTWENSSVDIEAVALVSESCIVFGSRIGSVEGCIDVIKAHADSLSDDANLQDLVGRLPSGIVVSCYSGELGQYEDLVNVGYSIVKKTADTVGLTQIYQFQDESTASAAVDDIKNDMKDQTEWTTATNVAVTRDGKYAKATADVKTDDIFK
jgi:hypothetical protein